MISRPSGNKHRKHLGWFHRTACLPFYRFSADLLFSLMSPLFRVFCTFLPNRNKPRLHPQALALGGGFEWLCLWSFPANYRRRILSPVLATSSFQVPIVLRDCFLGSRANHDRTLAVTNICLSSIQEHCAHPPLHLRVLVIIYSDKSLRCVLAGWWQGRWQVLVNMPAWRRTICLAVGCWRLACGCSSFLMWGCSRCSGLELAVPPTALTPPLTRRGQRSEWFITWFSI